MSIDFSKPIGQITYEGRPLTFVNDTAKEVKIIAQDNFKKGDQAYLIKDSEKPYDITYHDIFEGNYEYFALSPVDNIVLLNKYSEEQQNDMLYVYSLENGDLVPVKNNILSDMHLIKTRRAAFSDDGKWLAIINNTATLREDQSLVGKDSYFTRKHIEIFNVSSDATFTKISTTSLGDHPDIDLEIASFGFNSDTTLFHIDNLLYDFKEGKINYKYKSNEIDSIFKSNNKYSINEGYVYKIEKNNIICLGQLADENNNIPTINSATFLRDNLIVVNDASGKFSLYKNNQQDALNITMKIRCSNDEGEIAIFFYKKEWVETNKTPICIYTTSVTSTWKEITFKLGYEFNADTDMIVFIPMTNGIYNYADIYIDNNIPLSIDLNSPFNDIIDYTDVNIETVEVNNKCYQLYSPTLTGIAPSFQYNAAYYTIHKITSLPAGTYTLSADIRYSPIGIDNVSSKFVIYTTKSLGSNDSLFNPLTTNAKGNITIEYTKYNNNNTDSEMISISTEWRHIENKFTVNEGKTCELYVAVWASSGYNYTPIDLKDLVIKDINGNIIEYELTSYTSGLSATTNPSQADLISSSYDIVMMDPVFPCSYVSQESIHRSIIEFYKNTDIKINVVDIINNNDYLIALDDIGNIHTFNINCIENAYKIFSKVSDYDKYEIAYINENINTLEKGTAKSYLTVPNNKKTIINNKVKLYANNWIEDGTSNANTVRYQCIGYVDPSYYTPTENNTEYAVRLFYKRQEDVNAFKSDKGEDLISCSPKVYDTKLSFDWQEIDVPFEIIGDAGKDFVLSFMGGVAEHCTQSYQIKDIEVYDINDSTKTNLLIVPIAEADIIADASNRSVFVLNDGESDYIHVCDQASWHKQVHYYTETDLPAGNYGFKCKMRRAPKLNIQAVAVNGIKRSDVVFTNTDHRIYPTDEYINVYSIAKDNNKVIFTCTDIPTKDITAEIVSFPVSVKGDNK